jgi:hypothetical protein
LTASKVKAKGPGLSEEQKGEIRSTRQDHVQIAATLLSVNVALDKWSQYRV